MSDAPPSEFVQASFAARRCTLSVAVAKNRFVFPPARFGAEVRWACPARLGRPQCAQRPPEWRFRARTARKSSGGYIAPAGRSAFSGGATGRRASDRTACPWTRPELSRP